MLGADVHVRALVQNPTCVLGSRILNTISSLFEQIEAIFLLFVQHGVRGHAFMVCKSATLAARLNTAFIGGLQLVKRAWNPHSSIKNLIMILVQFSLGLFEYLVLPNG